MSKPLLVAGLLYLALAAPARADTLDVQLFPLSGEIRFHNPNGFAVPFVYYSITSSTNHIGALNPTLPQWRSISDFYDASGNGFIDPTHDWTKLSFTTTELTEGLFAGPGTFGSLPALRSVTLDGIWNPGVVAYSDLAFDIHQDAQAVTANIQLAVEGDYDHNGTVNQADYTVRRQNFGSTTLLDDDGNLNGIVDGADYAILAQELWHLASGSRFIRRRPIALACRFDDSGADGERAYLAGRLCVASAGSPAAGCVSRISNLLPTVSVAA